MHVGHSILRQTQHFDKVQAYGCTEAFLHKWNVNTEHTFNQNLVSDSLSKAVGILEVSNILSTVRKCRRTSVINGNMMR